MKPTQCSTDKLTAVLTERNTVQNSVVPSHKIFESRSKDTEKDEVTMPESNAAAKRRQQKANRAAGIGDEQGRLPARVKEAPKLIKCTVCSTEMKITKTNTELNLHATSKHGKTLEECFPGATAISEEMKAAVSSGKGGNDAGGKNGGAGLTKAQRKAKEDAAMDDLLSAGLSTGKKKGKK